jgi:hypothetical protein
MEIKEKKDIRNLSPAELEEVFKGLGEPKFRAKQVYEWLWQKNVGSFDAMTNLGQYSFIAPLFLQAQNFSGVGGLLRCIK